MPAYVYKAKKETAETVMGSLNAANHDEAIELLHQIGLLPVSVEESTSQGQLLKDFKPTKIKTKETYVFSKQLAGLIKSGVPLVHALEVIARQTKNLSFVKAIEDVIGGVRNGRSLSASFAQYPKIFSPLYVALVHVGEESGKLREMLNRLVEHQKNQEEIASKIRSALAYPVFMLVVGLSTVIFILTYVMPKISVLFKDLGQNLPWPTQVVLGISQVLHTAGVWGLCAGLVLLYFVARWIRTQRGHLLVSRIILAVPFLKSFFIRMDLGRFCRTLALLLNSGLPILRAIELTIPVLDNNVLKRDMLICVQGLTAGSSLGECLKQSAIVPELMVQLISVGEESGSLVDSLTDLAETYEQEISESTKLLTTLLEPIMILSIGLIVGFIVFAMLLPIFQMDLLSR